MNRATLEAMTDELLCEEAQRLGVPLPQTREALIEIRAANGSSRNSRSRAESVDLGSSAPQSILAPPDVVPDPAQPKLTLDGLAAAVLNCVQQQVIMQ